MSILYGSICLSDIPKKNIETARNGKKYLKIAVVEKKAIDNYGNSHAVKVDVKKDLQKEGVNYFIGNLKTAGQATGTVTNAQSVAAPQKEDDDLPF